MPRSPLDLSHAIDDLEIVRDAKGESSSHESKLQPHDILANKPVAAAQLSTLKTSTPSQKSVAPITVRLLKNSITISF